MEAFNGKSFTLEHCWKLLQNSEKWKLIDKESPPKRGSLTKMDDDDEDDDGPRTSPMETRRPRTRTREKWRHQACRTR